MGSCIHIVYDLFGCIPMSCKKDKIKYCMVITVVKNSGEKYKVRYILAKEKFGSYFGKLNSAEPTKMDPFVMNKFFHKMSQIQKINHILL